MVSQLTEKLNATRDIPEAGDEDESEDADEEQSSEDAADDEDDDESEDDDEEEEEPVLKYSKIDGKAADILEKDTASAIAVGPTYFVSGSRSLRNHS